MFLLYLAIDVLQSRSMANNNPPHIYLFKLAYFKILVLKKTPFCATKGDKCLDTDHMITEDK